MENPHLRESMGMKSNQEGVRIRRIDPTSSESASFDGVDIANDGTVSIRQGEHIGFSYLVSQKYTGDGAVIRILRDSKVLVVDVKLATYKRLIPSHTTGRPPSYYIIGGFVFSTVSVPQTPEDQLVVVSQVLVADMNIGYEDIVNTQVLAFNVKPVKNLKSLASMVEICKEEFLKFDLDYQQIVVLRAETARSSTLDILKTHCIPLAMSNDLKT